MGSSLSWENGWEFCAEKTWGQKTSNWNQTGLTHYYTSSSSHDSTTEDYLVFTFFYFQQYQPTLIHFHPWANQTLSFTPLLSSHNHTIYTYILSHSHPSMPPDYCKTLLLFFSPLLRNKGRSAIIYFPGMVWKRFMHITCLSRIFLWTYFPSPFLQQNR